MGELYWDNGKSNGNYCNYRGYTGTIGYDTLVTGGCL